MRGIVRDDGVAYNDGALALAFHIAEPRGTRDIDVNVFCPPSAAPEAFGSLPADVAWSEADVATAKRDGQVRLFWGETPVDVFFSTSPFHDEAAANDERDLCRKVPAR